jgi:long-chain acyl-CoA synthetase
MSTPQTVIDIFYTVVERRAARAMTYKQTIKWIPISSQDLYRDVAGVARALDKWGIGKGDRVALLSENRPEWAVADFATMLLGAVVVPIYPTLTADQAAYVLKDSGARVAFVSTVDQFKKVLCINNETPLEKVVVMDYVGVPDGIPMHRLMHDGPAGRDPDLDARAHGVGPDDLATIIYTSGTTGTPKGAMLTHGNIASNVSCSLLGFDMANDDIAVSYLPLSHITARHVDYALMFRGVTLAYCPVFEELRAVLAEVRPTVFLGVPRVYEKVHNAAETNAGRGLKRRIYEWALRVGERHKPEVLAGQRPRALSWKLADALVYSQVRKATGGRAKIFISGGAPLGRELADWWAKMGLRIHEGYGLTETSPVIAVNNPRAHKLGTVGKPLPNLEVKIADDGEVLVRGPSIFKSYWNMPAETAAAFVDGWFKTGDVGHLDEDGYLVITDRKKDLIKTSGGKFIAPQPIENSLTSHKLVAEAAVVGERHKFPAVLIVPDFAALEQWARENGVSVRSREEMVSDPRVRALYEGIVEEVNANLAKFEKLKKVLLLAEEFSIANGLLTPSLKLKRRVLDERYRAQIDALYAESAQPEQVASSQ